MKGHDLRMFGPIAQGTGFQANVTNNFSDWSRGTVHDGIPWFGTARVSGEDQFLRNIFYNGMGNVILETLGSHPSWKGFVWEMDLVEIDKTYYRKTAQRGRRIRRSYETLVNRVKVVYTDNTQDPPVTGETSWLEDIASQNVFGIKEDIIYVEADSTGATKIGQSYLQRYAGMQPTFVNLESGVDANYMEISIAGMIATAQFRYTQTADDSSSTVSAWISDIISTDLQFFTAGSVETNATAIDQTLAEPVRAWDLLLELLRFSNSSDQRYKFSLNAGTEIINYNFWENEPIGWLWNGAFTDRSYVELESRPRTARPGIYRDALRGFQPSLVWSDDSFFASPNDIFVEEFGVDGEGVLVPRIGEITLENSLQDFQRSLGISDEMEEVGSTHMHHKADGTLPVTASQVGGFG